MINGTQPSQELLEKNLLLTQEDWMNILADWSGSQKDTECGIRIRIPTDAGSVTLSSSSNSCELSLYLKMVIPRGTAQNN
ncbi:uncharacterized protein METZ01_LOCUS410597 [marine metagenome]|uniref:Uncharacterized protein n=1 Tax=marine metagenome TaxID=408172 RepID=A0A382WG34_9ZZZZ